jgi:putative transposase
VPTICLKYRLYPTKAQVRSFEQTLNACRHAYNWMLGDREHEYKSREISLNYYDQARRLQVFRETWIELQAVNSQVLQNVAVRVDLAFKAFFRRVKAGEKPGYPRFKGRDQYDSFTYPQFGFSVDEGKVRLSKIGKVRIKLHHPIVGKVKTCTVRRQNNKWYVCFACEIEPTSLPTTGQSIGIDVGLEKFAALSNGSFIENPRFFRKEEEALAKAQRKLCKLPKGSKERYRAKKVVSRVHERTRNRRHNFVHQLSRKLVNENDVLVVEKLNTKNMLSSRYLAKSISDASWTMFRNVLTYKAESAGRVIVAVNPAYTSQDCSACGYRAKKPLKERWHNCPMCGLSLDRDMNAAINILRLGLQSLAVASA